MTENTDNFSRYKDLGPLHDLLLRACPPDEKGSRSIVILAKAMGVSHQYLYQWIDKDHVPAKFVNKLIELSGGALSHKDFIPFAFK